MSVYLDDDTVSTLRCCTVVVWRVYIVDAQLVRFVFRVAGVIWAISVGDGRPQVGQHGYGGVWRMVALLLRHSGLSLRASVTWVICMLEFVGS